MFKILPLLLIFLPFIVAEAQPQSVWQIGKFDESPVEFSQGAEKSVTFEVGKSNASKDWPGRQVTGHPYRILFNLGPVRGVYTLRIATLIDRPRVPALEIGVNGHTGTFFLHPKLSYSRSDFSYAFDPHESQSTLNIDIHGSLLKQGENAIVITCIDDPPTPNGDKEIGGISYDALSLNRDAAGKTAQAGAEISVRPTVFYRRTPEGLSEVVDAVIRFSRPWRSGSADLNINRGHYTAAFAGGEFGERRVSFEVPEWTGTVPGRIRISSEPKRQVKVTLTPARKWTIFVAPNTHLDVGYTDYQGKVAETQARVLTQAADLIHKHPDFRFSMDGSWNLQQLLDTRPKDKRQAILNLIRGGKLAMPAQYCNLLTGYASLETLYRSLYESKKLA
ncbi:MAG: polysaccharide lyase family protein, partial [Bryobacteraceae bacterium]